MTNRRVQESWLAEANERYRLLDIPPKQRPFRAWRELSVQWSVALSFNSAVVGEIFEWFAWNAPAAATAYDDLFRMAYFFDAVFWPVTIPPFFGTVRLAPFDMLAPLPPATHAALAREHTAHAEYLSAWCAAVDWVTSYEDLSHSTAGALADGLLQATHRKLVSVSHELLSGRPSVDAAQSSAFAIELAIKRLLVVKDNKSEADLKGKRLGHNLGSLLAACGDLLPASDRRDFVERCASLPDISARYETIKVNPRYLWESYVTALVICAACIRAETHRNVEAALTRGDASPKTPLGAAG